MALSFRECHTKIRHVDAHATLNEGVVVQVMGELSNNMQPMRKFMQTFVLAPEVGSSAFISAPQPIGRVHPLLVSFRGPSQTNSTSTTTCSVTRTRCLLTLTLSLQKVRHPQTLPVSTSFTFLTIFRSVWPSACSFFFLNAGIVNHFVPLSLRGCLCWSHSGSVYFPETPVYSGNSLRSESSFPSVARFILNVCVSESEDEVEEIEEQVPSPDVTTEESAAFYNPVSW